ncbi:MAG: GlmU family protein [Bacteroidetes bacterium]|nr:GlmU family protein [Bacteroidota bacterium]
MNFILFDDARRNDLLPLTFLRPVCDIRVGILTIREKWERYLQSPTSSLTEPYLSKKYPIVTEENNVLINGAIIPNDELVARIMKIQPGQVFIKDEVLVAYHITAEELDKNPKSADMEEIELDIPIMKITFPWDIFSMNDVLILLDYSLLTKGRKSHPLSSTNHVRGSENIFIEEGAIVEFSTINALNGPVYIGKNAEIMEGCLIRGPFAMLDQAVLKMGTKIYGATTIGPFCKVAGEINNSVFFAYSNKAHDGYLGNSVIAEWCNLGAATNNSNLKNTYDPVRVWNYTDHTFVNTGLQFCGLIMGDHSKTAIGTMFNTGTVVGISSNIFGAGFPRSFVPSFSWGGAGGFQTYDLVKAIKVAGRVMKRRNIDISPEDEEILNEVFYVTFPFRRD